MRENDLANLCGLCASPLGNHPRVLFLKSFGLVLSSHSGKRKKEVMVIEFKLCQNLPK